ncbi:MAG: arsenate reductase ArsC [Phycisphaerales bacterium]|nr:arsenate reductase ArsC [Phycisphaerales bacterium]
MNAQRRILFLCTGNSCRSQMAEGWARELGNNSIMAASAGLKAHGLNPHAVRVMSEAGVDISKQESQTIDHCLHQRFDLVVTVCSHAHETCPVWPEDAEIRHIPFDDPPALARNASSEEEGLEHYRRVRDEIQTAISALICEQDTV